METFILIALIGVGLLVAELLLPTGGVLAVLGIAGLTVAGVVAFNSDSGAADLAGGALIGLGIVSAVAFYFITRKVLAAHRNGRVRTGGEELLGAVAEARSTIDPDGTVWLEGTNWSARLASGAGPIELGDRVTVEAVEGLTLIVRPQSQAAVNTSEGAS